MRPTFLYQTGAPTIVKRRFIESYPFQKMFEVYLMNEDADEQRNADVLRAVLGGVLVSGTGIGMSSTGELTWGLILALTRRICEEDANLRAGGWQRTVGPELAGRTLGLIGLGRLGTQVAGYGAAFAMEVIAWSENLDRAYAAALGVQAVAGADRATRAGADAAERLPDQHLARSDRRRAGVGRSAACGTDRRRRA